MGDFEHKEIFWGPLNDNFFILSSICLKFSQDVHVAPGIETDLVSEVLLIILWVISNARKYFTVL